MIWLLVLLVGCGGKPDDQTRAAQASDAVQQLFVGVHFEDCSRIIGLMDTVTDEMACHELIAGMREHGVQLLEVESSTVDGRDPDAFIVRARVRRKGKESVLLVRAEWRSTGWNLIL